MTETGDSTRGPISDVVEGTVLFNGDRDPKTFFILIHGAHYGHPLDVPNLVLCVLGCCDPAEATSSEEAVKAVPDILEGFDEDRGYGLVSVVGSPVLWRIERAEIRRYPDGTGEQQVTIWITPLDKKSAKAKREPGPTVDSPLEPVKP